MFEKLKESGWGILLSAFMILIFVIMIYGGVWLSSKLFPYLQIIFVITFLICLVVLLPMALFLRTRIYSGTWLYYSSFVFWVTLWVEGLLLTYILWGGFAVFIGLMGILMGVIPIAMLAALINGMWPELIELIALILLTFGTRYLGFRFLTSYYKAMELRELNAKISINN